METAVTLFREAVEQIVFGKSLKDKLSTLPAFEKIQKPLILPLLPARENQIQFSSKQQKFPKKDKFANEIYRGMALHFFANHELLAIEMMATALLIYPEETTQDIFFKKGILASLRDEQNHLAIYLKRMKDFGIELGDYPLNDFFWKYMPSLKTTENFTALVCLTFESANLDFSLYYKKIFEGIEDYTSAQVMQQIYQDEISHVAFGRSYLNQKKIDQSLWDYYRSLLPPPSTPARARGTEFSVESRYQCGLDEDYVQKLKDYQDDYLITKRRK